MAEMGIEQQSPSEQPPVTSHEDSIIPVAGYSTNASPTLQPEHGGQQNGLSLSPADVPPDETSPNPSKLKTAMKPGRFAASSPPELHVATGADGEGGAVGPVASTRKSVQFSRGTTDGAEETGLQPQTEEDRSGQAKPFSLYSKLRALAVSQSFSGTHARPVSGSAFGPRTSDPTLSMRSPAESGLNATLEEDTDADADAEESAAEGHSDQAGPRKRRRRIKRIDNIETAPVSPQNQLSPFSSIQTSDRPGILRRATDTDMPARQGVSEDEGRKAKNASAWSPRHPLRGLSYGGQNRSVEGTPEGKDGRRPLTLLNIGTASSHRGDRTADQSPADTPGKSRRRLLADRTSTLSGQRWRQLKNSLKVLGQRQKREKTQDQQKSAELLAELGAGTPAALMIASMFQRDEHGDKRIPVLLEQLKVSITDSEQLKYKQADNPTPNDRHIVFRVELEYGNGVNRMRWVLRRSLNDFVQLHLKYKLSFTSQRLKGRGVDKKLPSFPKKAFPYINTLGMYKEIADEDDEDYATNTELDTPGGLTSAGLTSAGLTSAGLSSGGLTPADAERPINPRHKSAPSLRLTRRRSSIGSQDMNTPMTPAALAAASSKHQARYAERQRKALENWLQQLIKFMLFRPDANRLCKFLEVSALGMRLAAEGSYHGKEGYLVIRSAKGLDFRRALTPANVKGRHTPKWFLVRHSYIVCVDSPEGMNIYDVFLFDSDFKIQSSKVRNAENKSATRAAIDLAAQAKESAKHPQHHRLKLSNSERKLKLLARNERQLAQFEDSIRVMVESSPWAQPNRFDSFAPVRPNCFAQWLVDGRDHMWVVSRALNQAKDVIYIHDWWLSPELYMRRPPAISQKWRLDRILKRKAEQGVKVFVIVYRNIDAAIPIDSQYTKFSLLDLHPNIFVQRSPNQFRQNTFFWAHHEKLCIVDHTLAFVGGIDLCFGRWDTPQHILCDDKPTGFDVSDLPKDADHCQLWPGKDYSNPRIQDFFDLNKPYEEMYDRRIIPRMPWHDISMQVVGQPARDLTRHFVQRWNYILRQRKPTRPTPFLLPPPDFNPADLEALGLDGTCEVQILRSAGPWSLGTPDRVEHSIMNAYVKMIEESEHFVYMENQFFISSCETEGATVYNTIGDALVERIVRAAKSNEVWRAVIIIPLIPGFQNTVEQEGGTSVRLIMQYQFRSICRGESSIFGRLKAEGIEPEDYIQFYSLRTWGKLGPKQALVTEQLYIHAKCIIVDDRVALIGSANVNERSMLGNRDSECAAIVRDTDMIWSKMNGKAYRVSRFAHTLRMRLMREHLGLDVDKIMEDTQAMETEHRKHMGKGSEKRPQSPDDDDGDDFGTFNKRANELREELLFRNEELSSFNHDVDWEQADNPNLRANRKLTEDPRVTGNKDHRQDIDGEGFDNMAAIDRAGYGIGRDTTVTNGAKEVLLTDLNTEGKATLKNPRLHGEQIRLSSYVVRKEAPEPPLPPMRPTSERKSTEQLGLPLVSTLPALPDLDDEDIGGPVLEKSATRGSNAAVHHHLLADLKRPLVDRDCMQDPVHDAFADDIWHTVAENNTRIYRAVFRCMPDNMVKDWNDYHQYMAYEERFEHMQGNESPVEAKVPHPGPRPISRTGPPGAGSSTATAQLKNFQGLSKIPSDLEKASDNIKERVHGVLGGRTEDEKSKDEKNALRDWAADLNRRQIERQGTDLTAQHSNDEKPGLETVHEDATSAPGTSDSSETQRVPSSQSASGPATSSTARGSSDLGNNFSGPPQVRRRRRATTRSSRREFSATDDILSIPEAEELLNAVQGNLVEWPYDWLERVEANSNWLFPFDQLSPIEIYI